jgi:hypothetical protein
LFACRSWSTVHVDTFSIHSATASTSALILFLQSSQCNLDEHERRDKHHDIASSSTEASILDYHMAISGSKHDSRARLSM